MAVLSIGPCRGVCYVAHTVMKSPATVGRRDWSRPAIVLEDATLVGVPGFFRVGRSTKGRWWLVRPDGRPMFHQACCALWMPDETRENRMKPIVTSLLTGSLLLSAAMAGENDPSTGAVAIVYHRGRLYHQHGFILDAANGSPIAGPHARKGRGERAVPATRSLLAIAGGHVYGLTACPFHWTSGGPKDSDGYLGVYSLDGKHIGTTTLRPAPVEGE